MSKATKAKKAAPLPKPRVMHGLFPRSVINDVTVHPNEHTAFQPAADTVKALKDAVRLYRRDVEQMLELTAE